MIAFINHLIRHIYCILYIYIIFKNNRRKRLIFDKYDKVYKLPIIFLRVIVLILSLNY